MPSSSGSVLLSTHDRFALHSAVMHHKKHDALPTPHYISPQLRHPRCMAQTLVFCFNRVGPEFVCINFCARWCLPPADHCVLCSWSCQIRTAPTSVNQFACFAHEYAVKLQYQTPPVKDYSASAWLQLWCGQDGFVKTELYAGVKGIKIGVEEMTAIVKLVRNNYLRPDEAAGTRMSERVQEQNLILVHIIAEMIRNAKTGKQWDEDREALVWTDRDNLKLTDLQTKTVVGLTPEDCGLAYPETWKLSKARAQEQNKQGGWLSLILAPISKLMEITPQAFKGMTQIKLLNAPVIACGNLVAKTVVRLDYANAGAFQMLDNKQCAIVGKCENVEEKYYTKQGKLATTALTRQINDCESKYSKLRATILKNKEAKKKQIKRNNSNDDSVQMEMATEIEKAHNDEKAELQRLRDENKKLLTDLEEKAVACSTLDFFEVHSMMSSKITTKVSMENIRLDSEFYEQKDIEGVNSEFWLNTAAARKTKVRGVEIPITVTGEFEEDKAAFYQKGLKMVWKCTAAIGDGESIVFKPATYRFDLEGDEQLCVKFKIPFKT
ncbi:unnamed protein product, partial [Amoebophrya sp. A120]|eukprot:GSA120T00026165001.1